MRRFLTSCFAFAVLVSLASADHWELRCDGTSCRRVLVRDAVTIRQVVAATPAEYVSFAPIAVSTVSYASFAPEPAAPLTTVCNCFATGVCDCAAGTCACAACNRGPTVLGATQYATGNSYYSVAAPTVMSAAPPIVSTVQDGFGNVYVQQNYRGPYARRVARHVRKGIQLGVQ